MKKITNSESKVRVGLPKNSNPYPDGTSVIMVGAVHEFGSDARNIPERSFLRSTVHQNRNEYKAFIRSLASAIIKGKLTADKALKILGLKVASDVQQKIVEIKHPPNTKVTIASKKSSNPLIDTGHLRQSITYEVGK